MLREQAQIICDAARAPASQAGDFHDFIVHHGSSACNGGGRIVESRRGHRRWLLAACGF